MLECVVNISEGCDQHLLSTLASATGNDLLDVHSDPHHHRSVFTTVGEDAVRALSTKAIETLDLGAHAGVHPRLGVVDVVPFVPLEGSTMREALEARDRFGTWIADTHAVPVFFYGPDPAKDRQLPDIRRHAWKSLTPDRGPSAPHPTAGAVCVGARSTLIAYNVWLDALLDDDDAALLRQQVRTDGIRVLTLEIDGRTQVSMNLVAPRRVGPDIAYARVEDAATQMSARVVRAELVGLVEEEVLRRIPESEWKRLDLAQDRTIESRVARIRR